MEEVKNKSLALSLLQYLDSPVIFLSPDGFILDMNQSALDLYGWKRENSIEKKFSSLLKEHKFKNPLPKNFPSHGRKCSVKNILTTIKKKSEEITVSWKISSIVGENHVFEGIILVGNDMSLQIKLEDKNHELESVIAQMPGNVYWYDREHNYLGCNDNSAKTFGISRQAAVGKNVISLNKNVRGVGESSTNQWVKDDLDVMYTGIARLNILEDPFMGPDNKMIYTLTNKVPLFDKRGKLYGLVGISMDITEQKKIQEDLEQAKEKAEASDRAKTDFLSNMSHDVKTPLAGIVSSAELLGLRIQPELCHFTQAIMHSGQRLMSFFENCIELSKMENGHLVSLKENFNLKCLLRDIMQLFQPAIIAKGLCLYLDYDDKMPGYLLGNRANLYRVLLNLMGNAIKFTSQGFVKITVRLGQKSTESNAVLQLKIKDTGLGIPEDKRQMIFDKFSRVTPSYQGSYEGHGIGLYIVQQFVEGMGGQIHVKSKEGEGSEFILAIPFECSLLIDEECEDECDVDLNLLQVLPQENANLWAALPLEKIEKTNDLPQEVPADTAQITVLLVEDDVRAQMVAKIVLETFGCHVDVAECGEKAIALFEPGKYNLVLMDIGLPDMKGYDVSKRLRELESSTDFHVPILGLSAHASQEEKNLSVDAGIEEMFSKPLLMDQAKKILKDYVISENV